MVMWWDRNVCIFIIIVTISGMDYLRGLSFLCDFMPFLLKLFWLNFFFKFDNFWHCSYQTEKIVGDWILTPLHPYWRRNLFGEFSLVLVTFVCVCVCVWLCVALWFSTFAAFTSKYDSWAYTTRSLVTQVVPPLTRVSVTAVLYWLAELGRLVLS